MLAAAAIKCTGGQILGPCGPRSDEERSAALEAGYDLDEVLDRDRLVPVRTPSSPPLRHRRRDARRRALHPRGATTESVSMRARSGTVRTITARHDRAKLREIVGDAWVRPPEPSDRRRWSSQLASERKKARNHDVDAR